METHYLALEIGGTKLQAAVADGTGRPLDTRRGTVDRAQGAAGIRAWFTAEVPRILQAPPAGIGIGFGGPVDAAHGRTLCSHQIDGWDDFPLAAWAEETFGAPALVENDANAAGWAEFCLGAGRGTANFVYMNIGSGIGGALVAQGTLYNGQGLGAAEIGHTLVADPWSEVPGTTMRLEDRCSGWSIETRLRGLSPAAIEGTPLARRCGGDPGRLTCADLGEAAKEGDAMALAELDRITDGLAQAVANVITLLHPEVVALGGGVSLMGAPLLDPLRTKVAAGVFGPYRDRYRLVPCALEEAVVIRGAALLAARAFRPGRG